MKIQIQIAIVVTSLLLSLQAFAQISDTDKPVIDIPVGFQQNIYDTSCAGDWTYSGGVRLSVIGDSTKAFQLSNTGLSGLAFRTFNAGSNDWNSWHELMTSDFSSDLILQQGKFLKTTFTGIQGMEANLIGLDSTGLVRIGDNISNMTGIVMSKQLTVNSSDIVIDQGNYIESTTDSTSVQLIGMNVNNVLKIGENVEEISEVVVERPLRVRNQEDNGVILHLDGTRDWQFKNYFTTPDSSSSAALQLVNSDVGNKDFLIDTDGAIGIGTNNPQAKVDIKPQSISGNLLRFSIDRPWLFEEEGSGSSSTLVLKSVNDKKNFMIKSPLGTLNAQFRVSDTTSENRISFVPDGGVVHIGHGTWDVPGNHILAVGGKGIFEEVNIRTPITSYPDYVFEKDYDLMKMEDLQAYIKKNKHLPGVPSVDEFKENGETIAVGDMSVTLLEKVEELTLYMLQLKEENEKMKEEIKALKAERKQKP